MYVRVPVYVVVPVYVKGPFVCKSPSVCKGICVCPKHKILQHCRKQVRTPVVILSLLSVNV